MTESLLGLVSTISMKLLQLAAEQVALAWAVNEDLQNLSKKLEMIQAVLADAQSKRLTNKAGAAFAEKSSDSST